MQSSHAILLLDGLYILQLRDNEPDIAAPGTWSLFGGMIQKGETPVEAIKREMAEELCIETCFFQPFGFRDYYSDFEGSVIRTWFFVSDVTSLWPGHRLTEGQDVQVFQFDELLMLAVPPVMRQVIEDLWEEIEGSWGGSTRPDRDIPKLAKLYREGRLPLEKLLSRQYKLDEINQALNDLENRTIVRALIDMNNMALGA